MLISLVRFSARAIARFVEIDTGHNQDQQGQAHEDIHRRDQTSTVQRIQVAAGDRTEREDVLPRRVMFIHDPGDLPVDLLRRAVFPEKHIGRRAFPVPQLHLLRRGGKRHHKVKLHMRRRRNIFEHPADMKRGPVIHQEGLPDRVKVSEEFPGKSP